MFINRIIQFVKFAFMNRYTFSRVTTNLFSDISNELVYGQEKLADLLKTPFSIEAFQQQTIDKKEQYSSEQRSLLVQSIKEQYSNVKLNEPTEKNIDLLSNENTFTVTTGHQLSLFTGPLFFIYKILNTIKLAKELSIKYPDYNYIPVFWMATEDHDFEEVQSVKLFNKELKWNSQQKGAVGRFDAEELKNLVDEFEELFSNHPESEVLSVISQYNGENYTEATFNLVYALFKQYGLIIIDGDHKDLKRSFAPIFEKELKEEFSYKAVSSTNDILEKKGLKRQLNAREINLFYLSNGARTRIIREEDKFLIEGIGEYSLEELLHKISIEPASFSPNVVLRPLYQESILPNVCYTGGGGEIAYWLQLKEVFNEVNVVYPLINVRNSLQIIDSNSLKKLSKLDLNLIDIFRDIEGLKKEFVLKNSNSDIDFTSIDNIQYKLAIELKEKITGINPGLEQYAESENAKIDKQLSNIKQKLIKIEKEKHDNSLKQIEQVLEKLLPDGKPQERVMNFFSLCSDGNVFSHLEEIYEAIDSFEKDFIVITQ